MKLSGLIDLVNASDEEVVITKNGRPAAVLVSPEEFENWKEKIAIRSDSALMKEIKSGLKALKTKKAKEQTLKSYSINLSSRRAANVPWCLNEKMIGHQTKGSYPQFP